MLNRDVRIWGNHHHVPALSRQEESRFPLYRRLDTRQGQSGLVRKTLTSITLSWPPSIIFTYTKNILVFSYLHLTNAVLTFINRRRHWTGFKTNFFRIL